MANVNEGRRQGRNDPATPSKLDVWGSDNPSAGVVFDINYVNVM